MRRIGVISFLAMTVLLHAFIISAQSIPVPLFTSHVGPVELPKVDPSLVQGQRLVTLRTETIRMDPGSVLRLNLFDDLDLTAICETAGWEVQGSLIWLGRVQGKDDSQVALAIGDGSMAGTILVDDRIVHIRNLSGHVHVIREIVPVALMEHPERTRSARRDSEWESAGLVNQERRVVGLHDLDWDERLFDAARGHAQDMATRNYYSHDSLDGRTAGQRMTNAGYNWNAWAENIAAGFSSSLAVHQAWMNSSGHRANILAETICDIGVGHAVQSSSQYGHYWTQNFGRKQGVTTCPPAANPPGPRPDPPAERLNDLGWITAFYVAYWGRSPDPQGRQYWLDRINQVQDPLTTAGVAENFALSQEAKAVYAYFQAPWSATFQERRFFIQSVYRNLLNREPDTDGLNYWVGELTTGATTPGRAIGDIVNAAMAAQSSDWLTIRNKVEVADHFTQRFAHLQRPWDAGARENAITALQGVTSDPATVDARKAWIDQQLR
ncbi:MAG: DUF4214 domain-containing protein [Desulfovibrionales bacterium]|nr:MAG: DUF4214 domain-containing protein [Desulfovibrionales bacterium]